MKTAIFYCLIFILLSACTGPANATEPPEVVNTPVSAEAIMPLELTSEAFSNGQAIPAKYSCTGRDVSPPLAWGEPPEGTRSFVLIVDDPDAPTGTWVHWILFNIPASMRALQEDLQITGATADLSGIYVGKNSAGNIGYQGPCPPSGTHRYFFKLYALDAAISQLPGATKQQIVREMQGHILAQGELMGTYTR